MFFGALSDDHIGHPVAVLPSALDYGFVVAWFREVSVTDTVDTATRSRMMSAISSNNTLPELEIRRRLFAAGFRYRIHVQSLPGKPDIVLRRFRAVILINGCFLHRHVCAHSRLPETRTKWWCAKLEGNARRDVLTVSRLRDLGWKVLTVWECSFRSRGVTRKMALDAVASRIVDFLQSSVARMEISRAVAGLMPTDEGAA